MAYMSRVHSALGVSPFEMLHGCPPRLAVPAGLHTGLFDVSGAVDAQEHMDGLRAAFEELDAQAIELIQKQFEHNRKYWEARRTDLGRKSKHNLAVGDLVLVLEDSPPSALHAKVKGPYKVVAMAPDGVTAVLETGATEFKEAQRFKRHVSQLAKFFTT